MPPPRLTWLDAWAIARGTLGLSNDEWLEMTPRQLNALRKRYVERIQREELLIGLVCSTTANFSFCRPNRMLTARDFMLHQFPEPPTPPLTGEMISAAFRAARPDLAASPKPDFSS